MRFLFRLFLASLIWVLGYWLFSSVLPIPAAAVVAAVLALAELFGGGVGRRGGAGGGLRLLIATGSTLISWPASALGLQWLGIADRPARIAIAAGAAAVLGVFAAGHGSGKESRRLWAVLAAGAIPLYALIAALLISPPDPLALASGAAAIGVALVVAKQAIVWPTNHETALGIAASAAFISAGLCVLPLFI